MALFKARRKEIESFETELSLPAFRIDTNGFIMFEDASLGGACVLEVIPHIRTESITLEDPVFHNESTDRSENPEYEPSNNALYGNSRASVYPPWVNFLNALQAQDESDEPTHIQILAKKCHSDEWYTRMDYADYMAHKELDKTARTFKTAKTVRGALQGKRAADYLELLDAIKDKIDTIPSMERDIRNMAGYKVKYYLVISYTPSSEGWWLDGRDSDYYISDHASPFLAFSSSQDKLADKITEMIFSRRMKKSGMRENVGGQEDDFFWIESDRTAQIIATRLHKVMTNIRKWEKSHGENMSMPFHLEKLDGREAAALIRFFPNIMTPYWDKIWTLQSDQNDMLYDFNVRNAIQLGDVEALGDQDKLFEDIKANTVDVRHSDEDQEAFLARFKNMDFDEISDIHSEYDDKQWSPEKEEAAAARQKELEEARAQVDDVWDDFAGMFALNDELKDDEQIRDEFLQKYKKRGGGAILPDGKDKNKNKKALAKKKRRQ